MPKTKAEALAKIEATRKKIEELSSRTSAQKELLRALQGPGNRMKMRAAKKQISRFVTVFTRELVKMRQLIEYMEAHKAELELPPKRTRDASPARQPAN